MAFIQYEAISVAASASGDITAYSTGVFTGNVLLISHASATGLSTSNVPWSTTAVVTVAGEKGLSILLSTAGSTAWTMAPRMFVVGTSGGSTALTTYALPVPLAQERIVVTVSSNASTGGAVGEVVKVWIGD